MTKPLVIAAMPPMTLAEQLCAQALINLDMERRFQEIATLTQAVAAKQETFATDLRRIEEKVTQPVVEVYASFVRAGNNVSMNTVCKRLAIKPNCLFAHLREHKVLMSTGGDYNHPYADCFIPQSFPVNGGERMNEGLQVTLKGLEWLCRCYNQGEFDAFLNVPRTAKIRLDGKDLEQGPDLDLDAVDI
jgi:phage antirepressor YoqD-like protein